MSPVTHVTAAVATATAGSLTVPALTVLPVPAALGAAVVLGIVASRLLLRTPARPVACAGRT